MELRDLKAYGEPGTIVYRVDCVDLMCLMPPESEDAVFADPPNQLSTGGVTVKSGSLAPVDKGGWDRSTGKGRVPFLTVGQEWPSVYRATLPELRCP